MPRPAATSVEFAGFRLDLRAQQLWRGDVAVLLRPRVWQLLLLFIERAGELLSADDLIDALWPGRAVTTKALTNRIAELRVALGDEAGAPAIIQTVPRRGYRLVAAVRLATADTPVELCEPVGSAPHVPDMASMRDADGAPGSNRSRAAELAQLLHHFRQAVGGHRQVVLVGGDPGLGKTWLMDRFVAGLPAEDVVVGRGQCLGQSSTTESFGPWLELLADLAAGRARELLVPLMRRCAPSWLLQLPWLLQADEAQSLRSGLAGAGSGRMLREGCALLDALAQQRMLVLVLEDLHWADAASIDLLNSILRGRAPARLLVLVTWRQVDAQLVGHPLAALVQEAAHGDAPLRLVPLSPLDAVHSAQLLRDHLARLERADRMLAPGSVAAWLRQVQRSAQGNPLLLRATVEHWLAARHTGPEAETGLLLDGGLPPPGTTVVPGLLRRVVQARLSALTAFERALLEAASVVGLSFTPRLLAAALQEEPAPLAQTCDALAQRQLFIHRLPAGEAGSRHGFLHDAYRQAVYDTLPLQARQRLHGRIARHIESEAGSDGAGVSATLASAYERAAMPADAARMLERTAEVSLGRFDYRATVSALRAALHQLAMLPPADARAEQSLRLHLLRGNVLQLLRLGHHESVDDFHAAERLASQIDDARSLVRARLGLCLVQALQGATALAIATGDSLVALAQARQPRLAAAAHTYAGIAALSHGSHLQACAHFETALAQEPEPGVPVFVDLRVLARLNLGRTRIEQGHDEDGLLHVQHALARSREGVNPLDQLQTLYWAADAYRVAGRPDSAAALYTEAVARAETFAQEGYELAARFGLLACEAPHAGRSAAMAALLTRRAAIGECWNAAGFELALAEACLADGDDGGCRAAVARGLAQQGPESGQRHAAALRILASAAPRSLPSATQLCTGESG